MILAVASGKGGTGKTTIAVSLALAAHQHVRFLDCDVEEPNAHIFLRPVIKSRETVYVPVPAVDESRCTACGMCGEVCKFNAIVSLKTKPLVFPELCHGCGGCAEACPEKAITEKKRDVGVVEFGSWNGIEFYQGRMHVGQAMSPPVIRAVKRHADAGKLTIIDCPPGTSCPVITAVRGCDAALLVTEPTPFGLHDLTLAVETMRELRVPFGVVLNRADVGDCRVDDYCAREQIPVYLRIPDSRKVAEAYSCGTPLIEVMPELQPSFEDLLHKLEQDTGRKR